MRLRRFIRWLALSVFGLWAGSSPSNSKPRPVYYYTNLDIGTISTSESTLVSYPDGESEIVNGRMKRYIPEQWMGDGEGWNEIYEGPLTFQSSVDLGLSERQIRKLEKQALRREVFGPKLVYTPVECPSIYRDRTEGGE